MSNYDKALVGVETVRPPMAPGLSRDARLLNVEALVWSRWNKIDGVVPRGSLRWVSDADDPEALAAELVQAGVWDGGQGSWSIVGYLDTQMSAERVERKRKLNSERYDRWVEGNGGRKRAGKRVGNGAASASASEADLTRTDRVGKVRDAGPSAGATGPASRGPFCEVCDSVAGKKPATPVKDYGPSGKVCEEHVLRSDDPRVEEIYPGITIGELERIFGKGVFVDSETGYPLGWNSCQSDAYHEDWDLMPLFPAEDMVEVEGGLSCRDCVDRMRAEGEL